ncbi:endonuclease/exonuclease/phosphatase family protein [Yinghuangia seranimata]|uniref:endonuclease/exonuclease/phosphatase family protein n=1 Tax=Yinghuangia seranimata TaxID=408067 RepID=UPI00248CBE05|nr:endonuclease/exonuclease/phosphatase family protein [Yinghuangia seranimata]MDI2126842.1 lamin tail domain-containing protein [Yinghuangia seranimata]
MATAVAGALAAAPAVFVPASAAAAPSADAVIAEVYGGGGNSGATLTSDFVELANRGAAAVALDGWSVQYLPAAPSPTSKWQATPLTGALAPGARYLVGEGKGAGGTVALPTPDASGGINMSGTAGTVALVQGATPLTCLTAADCLADPRVRDLVGYGTAVVREGTGAPAASNTTSVARGSSLADTDDNSADFTAGAPTPLNSRGEGPTDPGPGPGPDPTPSARIHDIQGPGRLSPLKGTQVSAVPGVVTAVRDFGSARGFWIQDPTPDNDPRTSEGVFVFTGSASPKAAVGDAVAVTGKVEEYYPGAADSNGQSLTEVTGATWTVKSSGNALPAPVVLDAATVPDAYTADGDLEARPLQPDAYALDLYEALEGERVQVADTRVVGATNTHNELWVTVEPTQNATAAGGTLYGSYDAQNGGRLKVTSLIPFAERPFPAANVGDTLSGVTAGPLTYDQFGGYTVAATTLGTLTSGGRAAEVTRGQKTTELAIATYNVENLSPKDPQAKFDRLAHGVVDNLARPDIVALEEIQDNSGPTNDGTTAADQTLQQLVDAIVAAGGPRYEWRSIDPQDGKDGGQPGGNIRTAFLFDPARVQFVDRAGGDATTPVGVRKSWLGQTQLTLSPGRIAPADEAWTSSRKPLAAEFRFRGRTVFVVANHFNSKGGDQGLDARVQPPQRSSEVQRLKQAALVHQFVGDVLKSDPRANVVVLGDLNDFGFSPALKTLTDDGSLRDLVTTLPANEQYGYVYNGNSQVLDHILTSPRVTRFEYDIVHVNAEFADQASDHDPQVLRVRPSTGSDLLDWIDQHVFEGWLDGTPPRP